MALSHFFPLKNSLVSYLQIKCRTDTVTCEYTFQNQHGRKRPVLNRSQAVFPLRLNSLKLNGTTNQIPN